MDRADDEPTSTPPPPRRMRGQYFAHKIQPTTRAKQLKRQQQQQQNHQYHQQTSLKTKAKIIMKNTTATTILLSALSYATLGHAQTQLLRGGAGRGLLKKEETTTAHHRELGTYNPTFEGALNANCCDSTSTHCRNDKESYEELEGDNWYARSCEQACETRDDCTGFEIQKFSSGFGYCTLWKTDIAYYASASNNNSDCYRKVTVNSPPISPPENVVTVAPTYQGALQSLCCQSTISSTYGCHNDPESYDRLNFRGVYDSSPCEAACNERDDCTGFEFLISESGCECNLWKVDIGSFSQPQWNNNACYRKVTTVSQQPVTTSPPTAAPVEEQGAMVTFASDSDFGINGEYFPSGDIVGGRAVWDQETGAGNKIVFYCASYDIWVFTHSYWRELTITSNGGGCGGYEFSYPGSSVTTSEQERPHEFWEYNWRKENAMRAPSPSVMLP